MKSERKIYGSHSSSSQFSRMFNTAREEVGSWLNRPLESYYLIVMIDACNQKLEIHQNRKPPCSEIGNNSTAKTVTTVQRKR
ncbi:MAG: transposase [Fermentimonas sp.]